MTAALFCWQNLARYFALPSVHTADLLPNSFARGDVRQKLASLARPTHLRRVVLDERAVYPYSVIPGGVRSGGELREIAARDYVVARHFANFDFNHARLVRTREARLVYMSYRKLDRIYWTKKKVHLRAGDLLLTDGKTTARARCGNQVSDAPQSETSPEEPSEDVLDRPVAELEPSRALPFRSSLNRPSLPGIQADPPVGPRLFAAHFIFPYLSDGAGVGLCESPAQESWEQSHGIVDNEKGEKRCHPGHRSPVVPEPTSMVLISSGLAAVYWRYRRAKRAA